MHPLQKGPFDGKARSRANDCVDGALRANRCWIVVDPLLNLSGRKNREAVEASANLAFKQLRSIPKGMLMRRAEVRDRAEGELHTANVIRGKLEEARELGGRCWFRRKGEIGGGKSELRRAVCRITSGIQVSRPEDGQCHREDTASATPVGSFASGQGLRKGLQVRLDGQSRRGKGEKVR